MYIILSLLAVLALTSFVVLNQSRFGSLPQGARLERIKRSPNYRHGEFKNQSETPTLTDDSNKLTAAFKFLFGKKERVTPTDPIPHVQTDLTQLPPHEDLLVWFGHSSYFMQIDGKRILVDPVFSGHASPISWMIKAFDGTNTYTADDMPDIDYLFVTHDHWDHLDERTLTSLKPKVKKVICGLGVGAHLEHWGYASSRIVEMDWYDQAPLDSGWTTHATPARHFSGRGLKANQTLWASFVLQTPSLNLFIGGDGGYDTHFAEIGQRFGPFDLAILEQGQYDARWRFIHLLPNQLFKAAHDLRAKRIMPVHHSKFALGAHPWDEPLKALAQNANGIPYITPMIGEPVDLQNNQQLFTEWWKGKN